MDIFTAMNLTTYNPKEVEVVALDMLSSSLLTMAKQSINRSNRKDAAQILESAAMVLNMAEDKDHR
jgi:hypothetical protein